MKYIPAILMIVWMVGLSTVVGNWALLSLIPFGLGVMDESVSDFIKEGNDV